MAKRTKRRKWAICFPARKQFVSTHGGGLGWTYSLREAKQHAKHMGGVVVDAEWLSTNYPSIGKEPIPAKALPPA